MLYLIKPLYLLLEIYKKYLLSPSIEETNIIL